MDKNRAENLKFKQNLPKVRKKCTFARFTNKFNMLLFTHQKQFIAISDG